jgi:hypothetical protein
MILQTTPSLQQLKRAIKLRERIEKLKSQLNEILVGSNGVARKKRTMSAAGRARVSAAAKKRWARWNANGGMVVTSKRRKMSAVARTRIAAAARARWAKAKASGRNHL